MIILQNSFKICFERFFIDKVQLECYSAGHNNDGARRNLVRGVKAKRFTLKVRLH